MAATQLQGSDEAQLHETACHRRPAIDLCLSSKWTSMTAPPPRSILFMALAKFFCLRTIHRDGFIVLSWLSPVSWRLGLCPGFAP